MLAPILRTDDLRTALDDLLASGTRDNPALNALIDSYAKYHVAFVVIGGLFVAGFAVLAVRSWRGFRAARPLDAPRWSFERVAYLAATVATTVATLAMALLVVANLGNAVDPDAGFAGATSSIASPVAGSRSAELQQAFVAWLHSGTAERPAVVDAAIDDRLAWQRPKAIICWVLLGLVALAAAAVWRAVIDRARQRRVRGRGGFALLGAGIALGPIALVLMAMVIGNSQASLAPLSMALFFG